jgi:8-oxo-dGTP pyrophosphatase MutT (NUDIX family)
MNENPAAISPISVAWLRERLARSLRPLGGAESTSRGVQGFERSLFDLPPEAPTPAAVLIPLVPRASGMTLLLTQRTQHLRDHAGQISFPGGRCEDTDDTAQATALREAQEEVGIDPAQVEILGELPEYSTATGFSITPVIGLVTPPLNLKLDDFEVAEVFEVPFEFLMDTANYQQHTIEFQGMQRDYYAMPWKGYFIWGATAGMIVALQRRLFAQDGDTAAQD